MASPPGSIGPGGQGRPTAPEAHLGLLNRGNPLDRQFGLPGGQRRLHGPLPAGLKRTRRSCGGQRFDPNAPWSAHGPAGRGGSQALVVIGARRIRRNSLALMGGLFLGPRPAGAALEGRPRGTPGKTLLLGRTVQERGMHSRAPGPAPQQGRGLRGGHRHGHWQGQGQGRQRQWGGKSSPWAQAGRPTPRAINTAIKGTRAKPTNSMFKIQPRRWARASLTLGNSPLRRGIAHRM